MQLRFVGTGGAFTPQWGNTSAFFTVGEDLYLLDCGELVFARLLRAGVLAQYSGRITVIITHPHADHCGSLATLCLYAAQVLGRPATVVHPEGALLDLLGIMGVGPAQVTFLPSLSGEDVSAAPVTAQHAPGMRAYAYRVRTPGGSFYYSGDNGVLDAEIVQALQSGEIDAAYVDANWFDTLPERPVHLPFETLAAQVPPECRGKVYLMHANRDFRQEAEAAGFRWAETDAIFG